MVRTGVDVNEDSKSEEENGAERIRVKSAAFEDASDSAVYSNVLSVAPIILISLKHLDGGVGGQTIVFAHDSSSESNFPLYLPLAMLFMSAYLSVSDCVVKFVNVIAHVIDTTLELVFLSKYTEHSKVVTSSSFFSLVFLRTDGDACLNTLSGFRRRDKFENVGMYMELLVQTYPRGTNDNIAASKTSSDSSTIAVDRGATTKEENFRFPDKKLALTGTGRRFLSSKGVTKAIVRVTDSSSDDITIAHRLAFTGMNESMELREISSLGNEEKSLSPSNFQTNESKLASDNGRYLRSPALIGPNVDFPAKDSTTDFNVEL